MRAFSGGEYKTKKEEKLIRGVILVMRTPPITMGSRGSVPPGPKKSRGVLPELFLQKRKEGREEEQEVSKGRREG